VIQLIESEWQDVENQYIALETVEKIRKTLDCTVDEMLEFTESEDNSK
jgi:DNA-binding Xre family transcriptional regulator